MKKRICAMALTLALAAGGLSLASEHFHGAVPNGSRYAKATRTAPICSFLFAATERKKCEKKHSLITKIAKAFLSRDEISLDKKAFAVGSVFSL